MRHYILTPGARFTYTDPYGQEAAVIIHSIVLCACSDGADTYGVETAVKYSLYTASHSAIENTASARQLTDNLARVKAVQDDCTNLL